MIYAIGDSFTYGDELVDRAFAWPTVLGTLIGKPVVNQGKPATGNYRMVKRAMDAVFAGAETVVIGWSDPCRQEFGDDISIVDIWAGRDYRDGQSFNDHRTSLIKYMTAYDVPEYYYAKWLRQIILVQTFCRANAVKCIMFNACSSEHFHQRYIKNHEHLAKHVDASTYIDWPMAGATDWTRDTPHGPGGHFLEAGHQLVAEKIKEYL
jgi:hypothetical protein